MAEEYCHARPGPLDEKGGYPTPAVGVEPEMTRRMKVRRRRGLEQQRAYHVSHFFAACVSSEGQAVVRAWLTPNADDQ